jgi:hypothetical protein
MRTATFFDRFVFPALDWLQLDCLRHPCTQVSAVVRDFTGLWFHPCFWQIDLALFAMLAGLLWLKRRRHAGMLKS